MNEMRMDWANRWTVAVENRKQRGSWVNDVVLFISMVLD